MTIKKSPAIRKITKPIHKIYTKTPHIEHVGFVVLAATEVFHLGQILLIVNIILMVSGICAVSYEILNFWKDEEE